MPDKRRLVTSKVCFGSEKAGLLENSYDKWALVSLIMLMWKGRMMKSRNFREV